jgi:hypothetical protein
MYLVAPVLVHGLVTHSCWCAAAEFVAECKQAPFYQVVAEMIGLYRFNSMVRRNEGL